MKLANLSEINQLNTEYQAINGIWESIQKPQTRIVIAATDKESGETHDLEIGANEAIELVQNPMRRIVDRLKELGVEI